jgi:hypothetical protein
MADFSSTIRTLEEQRQQLLDQVAAIDRAIAALKAVDRPHRNQPGTTAQPAAPARPRKPRTLSEEHKRKMVEGRRRSREAARAGAADAPGTGNGSVLGPPRLVKSPPLPTALTTEG